MTVERAFVLAAPGMDRHLAYVAMTRHREAVRLYAGEDAFGNMAGLVQRLSRSGLVQNAREAGEVFLARRGFTGGAVKRLTRGIMRKLARGLKGPSLKEAFLSFSTPTPVANGPGLDGETAALRKRLLVKELARAEAQLRPRDPAYIREQARLREVERQMKPERRRSRERALDIHPSRSMGMGW